MFSHFYQVCVCLFGFTFCCTRLILFIEDLIISHYNQTMVSLPFNPTSSPPTYHHPSIPLQKVADLQQTTTKQEKTRYNKTRAKVLIPRMDKATQQEKKSPKNKQKTQRQICSHCQDFHKNTYNILLITITNIQRTWFRYVACRFSHCEPCELCLLDSVGHVLLGSSIHSDSYSISFVSSAGFLISDQMDRMETSSLDSLVQNKPVVSQPLPQICVIFAPVYLAGKTDGKFMDSWLAYVRFLFLQSAEYLPILVGPFVEDSSLKLERWSWCLHGAQTPMFWRDISYIYTYILIHN